MHPYFHHTIYCSGKLHLFCRTNQFYRHVKLKNIVHITKTGSGAELRRKGVGEGEGKGCWGVGGHPHTEEVRNTFETIS